YEQPRSLFVADFIGTINFIQREKKLLKLPIQKDVLAIRPEKIRISHIWTKESIHAKVEQIEFRGSYYRIAARTQLVEDNVKLLIDLQVTQFAEMQLREGDNIYLTIPQEHMLHFDKE
ncbi:MAG: TOBE domain-containing protein, partial [Cellulosilyticaceae bacterium]